MLPEMFNPSLAESYKQEVHKKPIELQTKNFQYLITKLSQTEFGKNHNIHSSLKYADFVKNVPIRDYPDYHKYWDLILKDHDSVLWPGKPIFLATTSASTGTRKYIPVTNESITTFTKMALRTVLQYMHDEKDYSIFNHNLMNLTGSTNLGQYNNYSIGSISSVCRKVMPKELAIRSLPSEPTLNQMSQVGWDGMFKLAAKEAVQKPISVCTGLPSWILQFFNACEQEYKTANLSQILPSLRLLCTSGVNYKPYLYQFQKYFDQKLKIREMYGATEGGFAYQDSPYDDNMLLNLDQGIFFEFIDLAHAHSDNPPRFTIREVKVNTPYVPIISTNAGLWAYRMGDIIQFTSTEPFRISVLGRTKHFISIAAEHVYSQNVEDAMFNVSEELKLDVANFTVAPSILSSEHKPYYEWYIETPNFRDIESNKLAFKLDYYLKQFSISYANLRNGGLIGKPQVKFLETGAFIKLLQKKDTSSLQLKVPKVCNDRDIVEFLQQNQLIIEHAFS